MSIRVGLVGAGGVGARHARTLAGLEDVELVGIVDALPGACDALAGQLGVPVVDTLDRLLHGALDAVWLCVPPFAHGELELAVVRAGLPFFVEKPLAADLGTADTVAASVAAAGLPTATGYHWRHLDTVARAREALAGVPPRLVSLTWQDKVPPPDWWRTTRLSGGQVVEQATHVLDLARVLAGEVVEVRAAAAPSSDPGRDVADATTAVLTFACGALGTLAVTCTLAAKGRAGIEVAADGVLVELTETSLRVSGAGGVEEVQPAVDGRLAVDRAFVDVLCGRPAAPGVVDYAEALRTHRLACAVAESARNGSAVRVPA
ncbi:putative dehydrogenase [Blastococcus colisei]|uniref:Putative dehydrogenase n=1 Tax=Blastococcus colisei TaxID=1564162 RepID=A0A543P1P2_9ACTN|nr:Gfo/Idh/MocA family oxidoreductase [Blastococcus colisei]TQN37989.1 putative dehydrogenase [Blastococcus colisei]